jgi:hypothetical protein
MTLKGYVQSHHVDYFIGHNMSRPPRPNIRYVGSSNPPPPPPPPPTISRTSTAPTTPTNPPSGGQANRYGQCGGNGWTGPTRCVPPWTCQIQNEWYSQCL